MPAHVSPNDSHLADIFPVHMQLSQHSPYSLSHPTNSPSPAGPPHTTASVSTQHTITLPPQQPLDESTQVVSAPLAGYESGSATGGCSGLFCWNNTRPPKKGKVKGTPVRQRKGGRFSLFGECAKAKKSESRLRR
ncbi:hypothetical protein LWI29_032288 [Acer saccharum]|uniref:Uncharacterized protein n=1 Tax=Acer saccharum TaxID=4024 RepID=A0AA39SKX5_ACESA|nr:hypothetical protein LWI29_032288 [Acer saccharum]